MRRLLLVDPGGRVELCDLDSGDRFGLDDDNGDRAAGAPSRTAAWSPSGRWVARALDAVELDGPHEIRVRRLPPGGDGPDGSGPGGGSGGSRWENRIGTEPDPTTTWGVGMPGGAGGDDRDRVVAAETSAFYLCPSPCGRYLAHLSPGPLGLELGLSDLESGGLRIIERGQPLFWSWSADAAFLAVHVEDTVSVVPVEGGEPTVLTEQAGTFVAPWWMPDGSVVVAAGDRLLRYGLDGSVAELVGRAPAGRHAVDPEGLRLAYIDLVDDVPSLIVVDLLTGGRQVVLAERTGGFFWAPEGRRLAALVVAGPDQVQWAVHDGDQVVRLTPFRPGVSWAREVLPFFEQYSQSHTVWSPDGRQLVAPGLDADGSTEAVVQSVEPPFVTERVPGARLAWWAGV